MNTFLVFLSRVIGSAIDGFFRKGDSQNSRLGMGYMITTIVLDIVLGFAAAMVVAWFLRHREFRADAGAAELMNRKQPMINALARLALPVVLASCSRLTRRSKSASLRCKTRINAK